MNSVCLLDVRIDDLPVDQLIEKISELACQNKHSIVANVNIHAMNLAYESPQFRQFLNGCDIVFCDGFGVMLGGRISGETLHHRYTPPDWIDQLCDACIRHEMSMYFLGAQQGVAQKAADLLCRQHPGLKIAGTHHGYFDKTPDSIENQEIIRQINQARPDILLVGFGMPKQELWLRDNWHHIESKVALPVGALFDYVSGEIPRAPSWVTENGFEWLGRLVVEPQRLWKRYLVGNPRFFWRVLRRRFSANSKY